MIGITYKTFNMMTVIRGIQTLDTYDTLNPNKEEIMLPSVALMIQWNSFHDALCFLNQSGGRDIFLETSCVTG